MIGPIARYVRLLMCRLFREVHFPCSSSHGELPAASFPAWKAHRRCQRYPHKLVAMRAFECDLDRAVCLVESGCVKDTFSATRASHRYVHGNSCCDNLLVKRLTVR